MNKKSYKSIRNYGYKIMILMLITLFPVLIIGHLLIFIFPILYVFLWMVYIILIVNIINKNHIKKIKTNFKEIRVNFVDAFYYLYIYNGRESQENRLQTFVVVEDYNTEKKYCLTLKESNGIEQSDRENDSIKLVSGDGFINDKNFVTIKKGHNCSLWIKNELFDAFKIENDIIELYGTKLSYERPQNFMLSETKYKILTNLYKENDLDLLKKSTFIDGHLEFDNYKNGKVNENSNQ